MFRTIIKSKYGQSLLTLLLVGAIVFVLVKFAGNNDGDSSVKEIARQVTFDEAADKFLNNSYQIYTRGSLFVKAAEATPTPSSTDATPTPISTQTIKISETKYNDLFFYSQNSQIKRIDRTTYDRNTSRYFLENGNLVFLDNINKLYAEYVKPTDENLQDRLIFESTQQLISEFFPLGPLINEYKAGKFTPVERAYNLYSGKWQHSFFTSGEVVEIFLETDPTSGLFRSLSIVHEFSTSQTRIFFDFKEKAFTPELISIPEGYRKVESVQSE